MKSKFLVQKIKSEKSFFLSCSMLPAPIIANDEIDAEAQLQQKLEELLNGKGKAYIESFNTGGPCSEIVNCPDGFILLPLDAWHCKHDKKICNLQASIDTRKKERFIEICRANNKEGIFNAIAGNLYKGFHHVPGRYLCPSCDTSLKENQQNFKYHYPWELYYLSDFINFDEPEIIMKFRDVGVSSAIRCSKICAPCFIKIIQKIQPKNLDINSLMVFIVNFYPR